MHEIEHGNSNTAEAGGFLFWTDKKAQILGSTDVDCNAEENKFDIACVGSPPVAVRLRIKEVINFPGFARFGTYNFEDPASNPPLDSGAVVQLAGDNSVYVDE